MTWPIYFDTSSGAPDVEVPTAFPGAPDVRAFAVVRQTGEILSELRRPAWDAPCTRIRRGMGGAALSFGKNDPGASGFLHQGIPARFDKVDRELWVSLDDQWWWRGPITWGRYTRNGFSIRANTQEKYVQRTPVGDGSPTNYIGWPIRTDGWPGYFDLDDALDGWGIPAEVDADIVTGPAWRLWRRPAAMRLRTDEAGSSVSRQFYLPETTNGNVIIVNVPALLEPHAEAPFGVVGYVVHETAPLGGGPSTWEQEDTKPLAFEPSYLNDTARGYVALTAQLRTVASRQNRYYVVLYAATVEAGWATSGEDPGLLIGEVEAVRYENVGARAGWDVGTVASAVFAHLIDLWGGPASGWTRHNEPAGHTLTEPVRYFLSDHEQAPSILNEWAPFFDWWVEGNSRLRAGPRGRDLALQLSGDDLADLAIEWDASAVDTVRIAQSYGQTGPTREEAVATVAGAPNYLGSVAQAPRGISVRDTQAWVERDLQSSSVPVVVTGLPRLSSHLTADQLRTLDLADRVRIEVEDPPTRIVLEPYVDQLTLDPPSGAPPEPTWRIDTATVEVGGG